jgi:AcrR family transcriptional regulator
MTSSQQRPPRADAIRSRSAILEAAVRLLDDRPDTGVGAVAAEAGVTRQTVYAHFPSREALLHAALDHLTGKAVAAMDAADLDSGPAGEALLRLLDAADRTARRHPALLRAAAALPPAPHPAGDRRHAAVAERLRRIVQRGQKSGEFDASLGADWLAAAVISLAHAASEEAAAGRMTRRQSTTALHTSLERILRTAPPPETQRA